MITNFFKKSPEPSTTNVIANANNLLVKTFNNLDIQIYGTFEEPLFKANDIGELLGIKNIKDTIKDFNNKQIC